MFDKYFQTSQSLRGIGPGEPYNGYPSPRTANSLPKKSTRVITSNDYNLKTEYPRPRDRTGEECNDFKSDALRVLDEEMKSKEGWK